MRGRTSAKLVLSLREDISTGRILTDGFLPTERELAEKNGIAPTTARRALKILETEGLVAALPRRGYRVMARANDPDRGAPLTYILSPHPGGEVWDPLHKEISAALQAAATERGWCLLAVGTEGRSVAAVMEQLKGARTWGAILDTMDPRMFEAAARAGMPVLAVDEWREDMGVDAVVQDGFLGGVLAARCLLEHGCRRIAWMGPMGTGHQALERYGGATSVLAAAGIEVPPESRCRLRNAEDPEGVRLARKMLGGPDRPDGVLALWQGCTRALVKAAIELGLKPGADFQMVGWTTEGEYETNYVPQFGGGTVPPAVAWSADVMAEMAISRLAERRTKPGLRPIVLKVPVRLRQGLGQG